MTRSLSVAFGVFIATFSTADARMSFALVPQNTATGLAAQAFAGCQAAAKESGAFDCVLAGPKGTFDPTGQAQTVRDLVAKKIDGVAVDPADSVAVLNALKEAQAAGVPVVTWNHDIEERDQSLRSVYIGTNDYQVGVAVAHKLQALKPNGGSVCIQSNPFSFADARDRVHGFRDTLSGKRTNALDGARLDGPGHWTEFPGCPLVADDSKQAVAQTESVLAAKPQPSAFVALQALSQESSHRYQQILDKYRNELASGTLAFLTGVGGQAETELAKGGLLSASVAKPYFQMGEQAAIVLFKIRQGETLPRGEVHVGVTVCTRDNLCKIQVVCPDHEPMCKDETCSPDCQQANKD